MCSDRVWSTPGSGSTVWNANLSTIRTILMRLPWRTCAGGTSSASSLNSWTPSSSSCAKRTTRSPTCTLSTTAWCRLLAGGVSSSLPEVTAPSSVCSTPSSTWSCTATTWWLLWDLNTRNISGGRSIWPPCKWSNSSSFSCTLFNSFSTAATTRSSSPTLCASTRSCSWLSSPTSTSRWLANPTPANPRLFQPVRIRSKKMAVVSLYLETRVHFVTWHRQLKVGFWILIGLHQATPFAQDQEGRRRRREELDQRKGRQLHLQSGGQLLLQGYCNLLHRSKWTPARR